MTLIGPRQSSIVTSADDTPYVITYAATITPNCLNGRNQEVVVTGNMAVDLPVNRASRSLRLKIIFGGSGGYDIDLSAYKMRSSFTYSSEVDTYIALNLWFNAAGVLTHISEPISGMPL